MKTKKLKKLITISLSMTMATVLTSSQGVLGAWNNQGNSWYYLNEQGQYIKGWMKDGGNWYYMDPSGEMKTGWLKDSSSWYYLSDSGAMSTGWIKDNNHWYYLLNSGEMKTGWLKYKDTWYYLNKSGEMSIGWVNDNGTWYYTDNSGAMQTGLIQEREKVYYLDSTGAMKTGSVIINGEACTFSESGEMTKGNIKPTKIFDSYGNNVIDSKNDGDSHKETDNKEESISSIGSKSHHSSSSSNNKNDNNNNNNGEAADDGVSYLENYREQYHYSVPNAWGNDPNGMVYYNGEYHLFYQYYPDGVVWGPMHWGHAVSTDLIHWEQLGIAMEPGDDEVMGKGARYIYSGSAVVDENNTSGLFDDCGSGLVAIFTTHVEGKTLGDGTVTNTEEQSLAYSKDNGRTWIKYNNGDPILTIDEDPLNRPAECRDPKVFYNDEAGRWFMIAAGGPVRFFSSEDLIHWTSEAMQDEINTECPDFFKLKVEGSEEEKWVLVGAGRFYVIGDFNKDENGKWRFYTETKQIPMNFGKDSYASQSYYGTGKNGTPDGRRIVINWMNNWDYCNNVGKITKTFNGQYTLQNQLELVKNDDGEYRIKQNPIDEYKELRMDPIEFKEVTIKPDTNITSNISGSQYEIDASLNPDENTKEVGFKLRVGDNGQETVVKYNVEDEELVVDRSKSGKNPKDTSAFVNQYSQEVSKNSDGTIKLRIFVDASSVEVYANDGDAVCTSLIFPDRESCGIEAFSVGGDTKADIKYYPLKGIWNNENKRILSLSESEVNKEVGDEFKVKTSIVPETSLQGVNWEISDPKVVEILSQNDKETIFKVIGEGNAVLKAVSKDGTLSDKVDLNIYNYSVPDSFEGLENFESYGGQWYTKENNYIGNGENAGDGFSTSDETNFDSTATYTYEADAKLLDGGDVAGLTLLAQNKDAAQGSIVANIIKNGDYRVFKFPSGENLAAGRVEISPDNKYHLKIELKGRHIKYWINDELVCDADEDWYETGYFGLNICNAKVEFSNVKLSSTGSDKSSLGITKTDYELELNDEFTIYANQNVKYDIEDKDIIEAVDSDDKTKVKFRIVGTGNTTITVKPESGEAEPVTIDVTALDTNPDNTEGLIEGLDKFTTVGNSKWFVKDDAYAVNATGDVFAMSSKKITQNSDNKYVFETEASVSNKDEDCAPSLVLFSKSKNAPSEGSLVFNMNPNTGKWRIFEFGGGIEHSGDAEKTDDGVYKLKVVVDGEKITYYINDVDVIEDIEGNSHTKGYVGLMSWNANVEFRNTVFKEIDSDNDIQQESDEVEVKEESVEEIETSDEVADTEEKSEETTENEELPVINEAYSEGNGENNEVDENKEQEEDKAKTEETSEIDKNKPQTYES